MKKLMLAIGLLAAAPLVFTACSSTSHIVNGVQLNGNYRVSDVRVTGVDTRSTTHTETYNDAGNTSATILTKVKLETTVFDDVTPNCFIGSEWVLPHNGNGTYTIPQNGDCYAGQRQIVWSVRTDANGQKIFQLKILNGQKARKTAFRPTRKIPRFQDSYCSTKTAYGSILPSCRRKRRWYLSFSIPIAAIASTRPKNWRRIWTS